jgi:hypothetical protein
MTKTSGLASPPRRAAGGFRTFVLVSDFDIRISDFSSQICEYAATRTDDSHFSSASSASSAVPFLLPVGLRERRRGAAEIFFAKIGFFVCTLTNEQRMMILT